MAKRRRERDRPKAGPESLYNPNKRVLLSYASDQEDDDCQQELAKGSLQDTSTTNAVTATAKAAADSGASPAPPAFGLPIPQAVNLGVKDAAVEEYDAVDTEAERDDEDEGVVEVGQRREHPAQQARANGRIIKNYATGQAPALGSLAYQWDEDSDDYEEYHSEQKEAMEYLRAVRSERQGMPSIFKAQPQQDEEEYKDLYDSGSGDSRGFYDDDAYVARPSLGPLLPPSLRKSIEPQEAYTSSLKNRFSQQRALLQQSPTVEGITALGDEHPISLPSGNNKAYAEWVRLLSATSPLPAQIQSLDQQSVFNLLELLGRHHIVKSKALSSGIGVWIWSLLARLQDVGTLTNDEVFAVREFGKQAVMVQVSLRDPALALQLERAKEELPEDGTAQADAVESSIEATSENEPPVTKSPIAPSELEGTLATLDMIVVIVGDVFGQRDLLEFRPAWDVD